MSIVHPIRWPGAGTARRRHGLRKIVASSDDNEIDLTEAVERLRDAARTLRSSARPGCKANGKLAAPDHAAVAAALAVIPQRQRPQGRPVLHDWNYWNDIGMKTWAATGGAEDGRAAFHTWSAKAKKYDKAEATDAALGALLQVSADQGWLRLAGLSGAPAFAGLDLRSARRPSTLT